LSSLAQGGAPTEGRPYKLTHQLNGPERLSIAANVK
jgi:hypothetical protein